MARLWSTSLAYGNQVLIETSNEHIQQRSFTHMFAGEIHQPGMELADKLSALSPVENAKVFFANSGADANDTHIKMLTPPK